MNANQIEKMLKKEIERQEIIEYKKEKRSYKGIDCLLKLLGLEGEEYKNKEDINNQLWWVIEYCKKDEKLAKNVFQNFLWYDTRAMNGARIKDKYHQCELVAMQMIENALDKNFFTRIKFILSFVIKELKSFLYCETKLFTRRIKFKINKWVNGLRNGKKIGIN